MTSVEVHMLTSNLRNGPKRKSQRNWIGKAKSIKKPEHDQQSEENIQERTSQKLSVGHYAADCTGPKKVLSNAY